MSAPRAALCVIAGGGAVITALPASGPVSTAALVVATAVLLSVRLPVLGAVAVLAILLARLTGTSTIWQFAIGGAVATTYLLACHGRPGPAGAGVVIGVVLATGSAVLALTLPLGPRWLAALAPLLVTGVYAGTFWFARVDRT